MGPNERRCYPEYAKQGPTNREAGCGVSEGCPVAGLSRLPFAWQSLRRPVFEVGTYGGPSCLHGGEGRFPIM